MSETTLLSLSNQMADVVAAVAPAVVQVQGARAPVSGVVYSTDLVLTNARALGREDEPRIVAGDGREVEAELHGWDPSTGLALLRTKDLKLEPIQTADEPARVGHLVLALARSWSNSLTVSSGIISVIGGPHRTSRTRSIEEIIRTNAPMHDGFAGGAFVDMAGRLIGVITAAEIRGLGVIIPTRIAWNVAAALVEHGRMRRGYLGIAGQPVRLSERQRGAEDREHALLVVDVRRGSPAEGAGLLVGDVIVAVDGQPVESPEDLLDLLSGDRVGKQVSIRIVRGDHAQDATATIGEYPNASTADRKR